MAPRERRSDECAHKNRVGSVFARAIAHRCRWQSMTNNMNHLVAARGRRIPSSSRFRVAISRRDSAPKSQRHNHTRIILKIKRDYEYHSMKTKRRFARNILNSRTLYIIKTVRCIGPCRSTIASTRRALDATQRRRCTPPPHASPRDARTDAW